MNINNQIFSLYISPDCFGFLLGGAALVIIVWGIFTVWEAVRQTLLGQVIAFVVLALLAGVSVQVLNGNPDPGTIVYLGLFWVCIIGGIALRGRIV